MGREGLHRLRVSKVHRDSLRSVFEYLTMHIQDEMPPEAGLEDTHAVSSQNRESMLETWAIWWRTQRGHALIVGLN